MVFGVVLYAELSCVITSFTYIFSSESKSLYDNERGEVSLLMIEHHNYFLATIFVCGHYIGICCDSCPCNRVYRGSSLTAT